MEDSKDIAELYKMLLKSEEDLQKVKDKAFEEADIDGKLNFLKAELDSLNSARRFEMSQKIQNFSMMSAIGQPFPPYFHI